METKLPKEPIVVINDRTFMKTPEEKIALANAKARHKQFKKDNPNYEGL